MPHREVAPRYAIGMSKRHRQEKIEIVVGRRIRTLREERALTQAALAVRARTSQSNLARLENGERSPTLGSLAKIAAALQVDLGELLGGAAPPPALPKAEKSWLRVCRSLRDREEGFLRGVEKLIRALEAATS